MSSFLEIVARARDLLERNRRISTAALAREFEIGQEELDALVVELTQVQEVASRSGEVLTWQDRAVASAPSVSAPSAAEGERRQLTVMFCDLVGSTELSQRLDAEDLRELIDAYQRVCAEAIERFDGHIAQYLGDGVLVYFGYPKAHEDDAERAIRAGLAIQQGLTQMRETLGAGSSALSARIGVHTGPVVVSEMGSGARRETLAIGDTTNVAARLESNARPGSINASEQTLRLVPGMFVTRDLGAPSLKGVIEPLRVYEVVQASGSFSRLERAESLTPLIARDQELGLLLERWERAQEGMGQVVLLSGEAGVGKSRLLHAMRERLGGDPHTWLEGRCSPFTTGSAFQPVLALLRQSMGVSDDEHPDATLEKLEKSFAAIDGMDPAETVPYIGSLLGLPASERYPLPSISPELQRERTFDALTCQLLAASEIQPVISIYEDLHWADPSTLELLERTLLQLPTARVLLVLTFRTGFDPSRWIRSHTTPIALPRLMRGQIAKMVEAAADGRRLPDAVLEQIVERSDGVPLFVEELTRSVVEAEEAYDGDHRDRGGAPAPEMAVPFTLQDSLMARLDRLSHAKQVAQIAATLGREFGYALLSGVAELGEVALRSSLQQLVDAEILYRRGVLPNAIYSFKHALLHDTAYQSQLRSTRKRLHARVAEVLERDFPEQAEREPEVLARHYRAGGMTDRAADAFQRAGEQAVARLANEEAAGHFGQALELLASQPADTARYEREIPLLLALGSALTALRGYADPEVLSAYERVEELAVSVGEGPLQLLPSLGLASFYAQQGDAARWSRYGKRVLDLSESLEIPFLSLTGHLLLGMSMVSTGHLSDARSHIERAQSIAEVIELPPLARASDLHLPTQTEIVYATVQALEGNFERARQSIENCVVGARALDHSYALGTALLIGATIFRHMEDIHRTTEFAAEAVEIGREYGFHSLESGALVSQGWAAGSSGIEDARLGLEQAAATGSMAGLTDLQFAYADLLARCERWDEVRQAIEMAVETGRRAGDLDNYASQHATLRAECAHRDGATEAEREAILQEGIRISAENGRRLYELRTTLGLARIRQGQGRQSDAHDLLAPIVGGFPEREDAAPLRDARSLLSSLL